MKITTKSLLVLASLVGCLCQRSPYAGTRPIGFPMIETESTSETVLGDRFDDGNTTTTTEALPVEARGDRDLVNRLKKLPPSQQPFWFLNWKALEEHRKNPQTYQPSPNSFIDRMSNVGALNTQNGNTNQMPANGQNTVNPPYAQETLGRSIPGQQIESGNFEFRPQEIDMDQRPSMGNGRRGFNGQQNMDNGRFMPQMNQGSGMPFAGNSRRNPNDLENMENPRFLPQNNQGMQVPEFEMGNNRRPINFVPQNIQRGLHTRVYPQINTGFEDNRFMPQDNAMNNFRPQGFQRIPNERMPNNRHPNSNFPGRRMPVNNRPYNMNYFDPDFESQNINHFPNFPYEDFKKKE